MNATQTITVNELIEILKLYNPDELITFGHEFTPIRRHWDRMYMFAGQQNILITHYERGEITNIEPNL